VRRFAFLSMLSSAALRIPHGLCPSYPAGGQS
jgi:hypothetical protein